MDAVTSGLIRGQKKQNKTDNDIIDKMMKHFKSFFLLCCVLLCYCAVQLLAVVRHAHTPHVCSHSHTDTHQVQVAVMIMLEHHSIALHM